jgi:hypothetical protein
MALEFYSTGFNNLLELGGSAYEIADGQPNIIGWNVRNDDGDIIGDVDELLFSPELRKVRYMVINLDEDYFNYDDRKVIVPIGVAELHEDDDDVILPYVTGDQLAALPTYRKGKLNATLETTVRQIISGEENISTNGNSAAVNSEDFYQHEQFDQNRLYSRR